MKCILCCCAAVLLCYCAIVLAAGISINGDEEKRGKGKVIIINNKGKNKKGERTRGKEERSTPPRLDITGGNENSSTLI